MTKRRERFSCAEADLELVGRYQSGDERALGVLLERHYGLIKYWARSVLAWADREEILAEASIAFFQSAKDFNASKHKDFHSHARDLIRRAIYNSPEVRRVGRNLYKNYRKVVAALEELMEKLNRRPTLEELSEETDLSVNQVNTALNVIAAFPFPLEEADGYLTTEDPHVSQSIREAVNQLGSEDFEIIVRYYFYGQTDREIGEALDRSKGAITMARTRAIKKLRAIISGEGDPHDGD
jgi:RNA polymerase sigma factor (sigma-70 family)